MYKSFGVEIYTMSKYLRLELETDQEIADWRDAKASLGIKSNTDALRVLIRNEARNFRLQKQSINVKAVKVVDN